MSSITPSLQDAAPVETLSLHLLGKPVVCLGDAEVRGFRTSKSLALLGYLAVHPQPHSRQSLTGLLWSDDAEARAQNSLRVTLANLNKLFPNHLEINRLTVGLRADCPIRVDALEFEQLTARISTGDTGTADAAEQAVALYRGDFLDDLHVSGAPLFEEWLATQRAFYRERMLAALECVADAQLAAHSYGPAIETLERLLVQEPWHEAAYRQLMVVYSRMGDFNRALATYERCRTTLAAELDVTPMPETEALHERIQAARHAEQYELPVEIAPFVGRERELAQLRQMLADPACRLITICGLGGMGKSRLALALARQVQSGQAQGFLNGVVWVTLAGPVTTESVPLAMVSALHLPLSGQSSPMRQLLDFLQHKEMLIILDNLEAGDEMPGQLLGQILATCPDVKVLVTSWEPLNLAAEWRFDLAGLTFAVQAGKPAADVLAEMAATDAIQLFVQTARQVRPAFQLTAENAPYVQALCQQVGGIPLAIKLAAAWLRMMPVEEVVEEAARGLDLLATQMRDVPSRQRSMRAILDRTWAMLLPAEARALARLSIFRGGFRREAAAAVAEATLPTLMALMDRALLQVDGSGRYFLHEPLRHFAAERLAQEPGELAQCQARHTQYFATLLDQQAKPMRGHGQRQAVAAVAADIENIRLAWQQMVATTDIAAIGRSVDVLIAFYDMRGWYAAGINLLEEAVAQLEHQPRTVEVETLLAKLFVHLGWAYIRLGQYDKATAATTRSQTIYQTLQLAPPPGLGTEPLVGLGVLANIRGDYAEAFRLGEEARRVSAARGDEDNVQNALAVLTSTAFAEGNYAEAERYARQAHHLAVQVENHWFLAYILDDLGMIESALGNYEAAAHHYARSYALRQEFDDAAGMAITSMHMAETALHQQQWAEAAARYEESLQSYYAVNDRGGVAAAHEGLARVAAAQGDMTAAQNHFHSALQTAAQIGFTPVLLSILTGVAEFLLQTDRRHVALTVLQTVKHHRASNASTRQRAAQLLATHAANGDGAAERGREHDLDTLVTRLLVELAIQPR